MAADGPKRSCAHARTQWRRRRRPGHGRCSPSSSCPNTFTCDGGPSGSWPYCRRFPDNDWCGRPVTYSLFRTAVVPPPPLVTNRRSCAVTCGNEFDGRRDSYALPAAASVVEAAAAAAAAVDKEFLYLGMMYLYKRRFLTSSYHVVLAGIAVSPRDEFYICFSAVSRRTLSPLPMLHCCSVADRRSPVQ